MSLRFLAYLDKSSGTCWAEDDAGALHIVHESSLHAGAPYIPACEANPGAGAVYVRVLTVWTSGGDARQVEQFSYDGTTWFNVKRPGGES